MSQKVTALDRVMAVIILILIITIIRKPKVTK